EVDAISPHLTREGGQVLGAVARFAHGGGRGRNQPEQVVRRLRRRDVLNVRRRLPHVAPAVGMDGWRHHDVPTLTADVQTATENPGAVPNLYAGRSAEVDVATAAGRLNYRRMRQRTVLSF